MRHGLTDEQIEELAHFIRTNHWGPQNRTTNAKLARTFHFPDLGSAGRPGIPGSSMLADALLRARQMGHPIVSGGRGIFYASEREDVNKALEHLRRLENRYRSHRIALAFTASKLPGQSVRSTPHRVA